MKIWQYEMGEKTGLRKTKKVGEDIGRKNVSEGEHMPSWLRPGGWPVM